VTVRARRIVIAEFMDDAAVRALAVAHDTLYDPHLVDRQDALVAAVVDTDALIVRNRTQVNAPLLAAAPRLRVVGRLGVGLDNIDVAACAQRNVEVIPATGANALAVAEYVIATAMLLLRGAYGSTADVVGGGWPRGTLSTGREIAGKTLGIVGFGGIGRLTAGLARGLGMRLVACDPQLSATAEVWDEEGVTCTTLDTVFREADVVTLHVPLTAGTRHLVDASRLAAMKPDAVLINTSRGGVVDEAALAAALRTEKLGGAALDVFESEPLPAGAPLADCPHLILTPHIAGVTRESNIRVSMMIAERLAAFLAAL
jgi:(S)-sulfolactate dehydrogenase